MINSIWISLRGVGGGIVAMIVAGFICLILMTLVDTFLWQHMASKPRPLDTLIATARWSPIIYLLSGALAIFFFGGYVAARLTRFRPIVHAMMTSVLVLVSLLVPTIYTAKGINGALLAFILIALFASYIGGRTGATAVNAKSAP